MLTRYGLSQVKVIDNRLSELKAEKSDLPRDQSEICNLLQIRSLLLRGIDCSVPCSVTPKQSNSRALLMNKQDDCDGSSFKALESASQQCSKLTNRNFEALTSKWPNMLPSAPAPSVLYDASASSLSAHAVASAQWAAKRADSKPTIEAMNPKKVSDHSLHCPITARYLSFHSPRYRNCWVDHKAGHRANLGPTHPRRLPLYRLRQVGEGEADHSATREPPPCPGFPWPLPPLPAGVSPSELDPFHDDWPFW